MARGRVYLVGAGPGDPGLLTVRGQQVLRLADVVFYDGLVGREVLRLIPRRARRRRVAKGPRHQDPFPQSRINQLLVREAKAGRQVVRLKGGDAFFFSRGGEEVEALRRQGIPFEVVPGVTSALAGPAFAGIPLTERRYRVVRNDRHRTRERVSPSPACELGRSGTQRGYPGNHDGSGDLEAGRPTTARRGPASRYSRCRDPLGDHPNSTDPAVHSRRGGPALASGAPSVSRRPRGRTCGRPGPPTELERARDEMGVGSVPPGREKDGESGPDPHGNRLQAPPAISLPVATDRAAGTGGGASWTKVPIPAGGRAARQDADAPMTRSQAD